MRGTYNPKNIWYTFIAATAGVENCHSNEVKHQDTQDASIVDTSTVSMEDESHLYNEVKHPNTHQDKHIRSTSGGDKCLEEIPGICT